MAPSKAGGGCLEMTIPTKVLEHCQIMDVGQSVDLIGNNKLKGGRKSSSNEAVQVTAKRQKHAILFSLNASSMGAVFQKKLSQTWQCELSGMKADFSIGAEDPSDDDNYEPEEMDEPEEEPAKPARTTTLPSLAPSEVKQELDDMISQSLLLEVTAGTSDDIPQPKPLAQDVAFPATDPGEGDHELPSSSFMDSSEGDLKFPLGGFGDGQSVSTAVRDATIGQVSGFDSMVEPQGVEENEAGMDDEEDDDDAEDIDDADDADDGDEDGEDAEDNYDPTEEPKAKKPKINNPRLKTTTKLEDLVCEFCQRSWFPSLRAYHRHYYSCHASPHNPKTETQEDIVIRKRFTCDICLTVCPRNRLKKHREAVHNIVQDSDDEDDRIIAPLQDSSASPYATESVNISKSSDYQARWSAKLLKDWLQRQNKSTEFENLLAAELDGCLCAFYADVKPQSLNGTPGYSRSAYFNIRAGINWHLRNAPYNRDINLMKHKEFDISNLVLSQIVEKLQRSTSKKEGILQADLNQMYQGIFNISDAHCLMFKVFFEVMLHFHISGRGGLRQLTKQSFIIMTGNDGVDYVTYIGKASSSSAERSPVFMYAKPGSHLCPVSTLRLYLSKLNPRNDAFFQSPLKNYRLSDKTWYSSQPLGRNVLSSMMTLISEKAQLSKIYTNKCIKYTDTAMISFERQNEQKVTSCKTEEESDFHHDHSTMERFPVVNLPSESQQIPFYDSARNHLCIGNMQLQGWTLANHSNASAFEGCVIPHNYFQVPPTLGVSAGYSQENCFVYYK